MTQPHADPPPPGKTRIYAFGPAELFGAIPYALGFHPAPGDVVVAGLVQGWIAGIGRGDIATPVDDLATALLTCLYNAPGVDAVVIAGYAGPDADAYLAELAMLFLAAGYPLTHVFRAHEHRVFCLICDCCGTTGVPFDPVSSNVAMQAVVAGRVALPSRQAVLDQLAHDLVASAALSAAMDIAAGPLAADPPGDAEATEFIDQVLARARCGERIDDTCAARLVLLLAVNTHCRDYALSATGDQPWLAALWQDLTRRCPREAALAAIPTLAAWSAWRCGNTLLARTAIDIALACDPEYQLAALIRDLLLADIPPSRMEWPPIDQDGGS